MRGRTWLMLDVLTNLFQTCSWFKTNGYKLITNTKVSVWGAILHKARIYSNVGRISTTAPLTPNPLQPRLEALFYFWQTVWKMHSLVHDVPTQLTSECFLCFFSFSFWTIFVIGSNTSKPNTKFPKPLRVPRRSNAFHSKVWQGLKPNINTPPHYLYNDFQCYTIFKFFIQPIFSVDLNVYSCFRR